MPSLSISMWKSKDTQAPTSHKIRRDIVLKNQNENKTKTYVLRVRRKRRERSGKSKRTKDAIKTNDQERIK